MRSLLQTLGWLACVVYSTIPGFWFLVHPRAAFWRSRRYSPYLFLIPAWVAMWGVVAAITARWRYEALYRNPVMWVAAILLFAAGFWLYLQSGKQFSPAQLGGLPEVVGGANQQELVTTGIRARLRHPVYLAHLCEMLGWSVGTGLVVLFAMTVFAIVTGAIMIRMEDAELEQRFGEQFRDYRAHVPAVLPRIF